MARPQSPRKHDAAPWLLLCKIPYIFTNVPAGRGAQLSYNFLCDLSQLVQCVPAPRHAGTQNMRWKSRLATDQ